MPCLVSIVGKSFELETDADGVLEFPVPSNARAGSVKIGEGDGYETYDLDLGLLDPADTIRGVQQKLANLRFYDSDPKGEIDDATGQAIHNFQDMYGLEVSDEIYELLIEKLIESNGT